jgi:hypothetical protein
MKKSKSIRLAEYAKHIPTLNEQIEAAMHSRDYNRYMPVTLYHDMLIIAKFKLLGMEDKLPNNDYVNKLKDVIKLKDGNGYIVDVFNTIAEMSKRYDLRKFEKIARMGSDDQLDFEDTENPVFNYNFELDVIDDNVAALLDISEEQLQEIEELPEDVEQILTMANYYGAFMKTKEESYIGESRPMENYGDVTKIGYYKFSDPMFNFKFAVKAYETPIESKVDRGADTMVIGYFLYAVAQHSYKTILKLLGLLALEFKGGTILIYDFLGNTYDKHVLSNKEEIVDFFKSQRQPRLFSSNNEYMLEVMAKENPGADIVFFPNVNEGCVVDINRLNGCKINFIIPYANENFKDYEATGLKTNGNIINVE